VRESDEEREEREEKEEKEEREDERHISERERESERREEREERENGRCGSLALVEVGGGFVGLECVLQVILRLVVLCNFLLVLCSNAEASFFRVVCDTCLEAFNRPWCCVRMTTGKKRPRQKDDNVR
jgi:hypothetical protein